MPLTFDGLIELHDDIMKLHEEANKRIPAYSEYAQVAVSLLLAAAHVLDAADKQRKI